MKTLAPLLGLGLAAAVAAQSPLTTLFAATTQLINTAGVVAFFDLTVNTTITVDALDINTNSALGTAGTIRLYQTNTGITSFSGSELNPANWTLLAEGSVYAAGFNAPSRVCFRNPVTLAPGSSGYAVMHIGVNAIFTTGNGTNQNYSNAELTLNAGAVQGTGPYYPDGAVKPFLGNPFNPYVFNGNIHYTNGAVGTPCANTNKYGAGCGSRFASTYELIELPANASAQMTGRSVTFIPDSFPVVTSYSVVTNAGAIVDPTAHVALAGFASTIVGAVPLDDGEVTVAVPGGNFPFPGGTTANLTVHTNGMVSVASNLTYLDGFGGDDWAPLVPALMNAPNALWCSWHDYDIGPNGAGQIKSFDTGTSLIITYEGVESYPTGAGNPSTLQFIFDYSNGVVSITWDSITATAQGGGYVGDTHLIGFSPGGANLTPGAEFDVTQVAATSTVDSLIEVLPLTLSASPRPVIGATIDYTVTNVSAPASIGILFLGLADLPGLSPIGLDLGFLGAPGCVLNFDLNGAFSTVIFPGTPFQLTTDNTYIGLKIYGQAAWLDAAANAFGFTTSNATYQLCEVN